MPRSNDNSPNFYTQQSSSQAEDFQPTQQEESIPRSKEQSLGQKFTHWFDFTFADYSKKLRQKAIRAGQEATRHTLFKAPAQCCGLPGPSQDQQPAELVYAPKNQDIQYRNELGSREPFTIGQTISRQEELNHLQPGRDSLLQWRSRRAQSTT